MKKVLNSPLLLLSFILAIHLLTTSCNKKDYVEPAGIAGEHNVAVTAKVDGKNAQIVSVQVFKGGQNIPWYLAEQNPGTIQMAALGIIQQYEREKLVKEWRSNGGSVGALFENWPVGEYMFLIFVRVNGQVAMTRTSAVVKEGYATQVKADFGPSTLLVFKSNQQHNLSIDFGRYSGKVQHVKLNT